MDYLQLQQVEPIHSAYVESHNPLFNINLEKLNAAGGAEVMRQDLLVELIFGEFAETSRGKFDRCFWAITLRNDPAVSVVF